MVVGSFPFCPIVRDHRQVEVPALHLRLAPLDHLQGASAQGQRGETRGAAQAFLRPAVAGIDPPRVHPHGHAAEGRDGVHDKERPVLPAERAYLLHRLMGAGGGLRMDQGDRFDGACLPERVLQAVRVDGLSPRDLERDCLAARASHDVGHACAEHAVYAHDHAVARLDQVYQRCLHAGRAGAGHGDGERVLCLEDCAQQSLHLVHDREEFRVQMAEQRRAHGAQHAGMDEARTRTEQEPRRRG